MSICIWVSCYTNPYHGLIILLFKLVAKASQLFNFLRRNLSNCSPSVKATAYLTIFHPVLEYAASLWDPYQQNDILSLEKVQRRAARWALSDYIIDLAV